MNKSFMVGDRLYLRELDPEADLDRYLRWINDPAVLSTLGRRRPMGRAAEQEWLRDQYNSDDHMNLGVVPKERGSLHRQLRLQRDRLRQSQRRVWDPDRREGRLGTRIRTGGGTPDLQVRVFEELGLHRIGLDVYSHNARAICAYEKPGFVREGTLRESYFPNGVHHDTIVMSVLESEWRNR